MRRVDRVIGVLGRVKFGKKKMNSSPLVSVIDDDESVRESLPDLLRELGYSVEAFSSAERFLTSDCGLRSRCIIVDVAMPGMSGPDLQRELVRCRLQMPLIFVTAHGDDAMRLRLINQGAVECLFKPFSDIELLDALEVALQGSSDKAA